MVEVKSFTLAGFCDSDSDFGLVDNVTMSITVIYGEKPYAYEVGINLINDAGKMFHTGRKVTHGNPNEWLWEVYALMCMYFAKMRNVPVCDVANNCYIEKPGFGLFMDCKQVMADMFDAVEEDRIAMN